MIRHARAAKYADITVPSLDEPVGSAFEGKIIAWGYFRDEPTEIFSVMILVDPAWRNRGNYVVCHLENDMMDLTEVRYYINIVSAVQDYSDIYGMDI